MVASFMFRFKAVQLVILLAWLLFVCCAGMPWGTQEDGIMRILAHKYCRSFSVGHGHFMWNFRTELEARWSYLEARCQPEPGCATTACREVAHN